MNNSKLQKTNLEEKSSRYTPSQKPQVIRQISIQDEVYKFSELQGREIREVMSSGVYE